MTEKEIEIEDEGTKYRVRIRKMLGMEMFEMNAKHTHKGELNQLEFTKDFLSKAIVSSPRKVEEWTAPAFAELLNLTSEFTNMTEKKELPSEPQSTAGLGATA